MGISPLGWKMLRDPACYANILNVLLMILYVCLDYERGYINKNKLFGSVGFSVGAVGFLFDALLYWTAWEGITPHPDRMAISSEYLNILASCIYLATSFMYALESQQAFADAVFILEAIATLVFFLYSLAVLGGYLQAVELCDDAYVQIDSGGYTSSAENVLGKDTSASVRRLACTPAAVWAVVCQFTLDVDFWANLFNIVGAVVYLVSSTSILQLHFLSRDDLLQSSAALPPNWNHTSTAAESGASAVAFAAASAGGYGLRGLARRLQSSRPTSLGERRPELLVSLSRSYVIGDVLWLVDAVLFTISWYKHRMLVRDKEEAEGQGYAAMNSHEGVSTGQEKSGPSREAQAQALAVAQMQLNGGFVQGSVGGVEEEKEEEEGYHVLLCLHKPVMACLCCRCCAGQTASWSSSVNPDAVRREEEPFCGDCVVELRTVTWK